MVSPSAIDCGLLEVPSPSTSETENPLTMLSLLEDTASSVEGSNRPRNGLKPRELASLLVERTRLRSLTRTADARLELNGVLGDSGMLTRRRSGKPAAVPGSKDPEPTH